MELQIKHEQVQCTANTVFNQDPISLTSLMKLGEWDSLKLHKHTVKLVNNTELPLLGSLQLDVNKNSTLTILFYITLIELPHEGLSKLFF